MGKTPGAGKASSGEKAVVSATVFVEFCEEVTFVGGRGEKTPGMWKNAFR